MFSPATPHGPLENQFVESPLKPDWRHEDCCLILLCLCTRRACGKTLATALAEGALFLDASCNI